MFIAVLPYKMKTNFLQDGKLLVLDTEDMSLEYVTKSDILEYNIEIYMSTMYHRYGKFSYSPTALRDYLCNAKKSDAIHYVGREQDVYFIDNTVRIETSDPDMYNRAVGYEINGVVLCLCISGEIIYVFRYRDCYVARIRVVPASGYGVEWWSAVINREGRVISYWDEGFNVTMNSKLGLQIDTVMRY